jgi:DNA-binding NarL/FixJ family response regulator
MKIKVLLADDHGIIRQGIRLLLEAEPDIEIVGEAASGHTALNLVEKLGPDIVLMDISMADLNGLEATRTICARYPTTQVIILSMHTEERYVLSSLHAGAHGYVLKQGLKDEMLMAIRAVHRGEYFLASRISATVVHNYLNLAADNAEAGPLDRLTLRERQILQMIAEGHSNQEIANRLVLSAKTVERHRANLMSKLGIHNTAGLVRFAIQYGLISLDG